MMRGMCLFAPLLLVFSGCNILFELADPNTNSNTNANTGPVETGKVGLQQFKSAAEFEEYFAEQVDTDNRYGLRNGGGMGDEDMQFDAETTSGEGGAPTEAPTSEADGSATSSDDFSTTTTQEEGVQEADVIKNDGTYVYVLSNSVLRIVQADPGEELQEIPSVELEGYGQDLYLLEDKVVALTQPSVVYESPTPLNAQESIASPSCYRSRVQVTVVDVTDRANPAIESTTWFEGSLSSSRMIGDMLHLVLVNYPDFFMPLFDFYGDQPAVAEVDVDTILPDFEVAIAGDEPVSGNTVDWPSFYYPIDPDGYGMTTVISLDINNPAEFRSVGVVAYPGNIYASLEALYLTDSNYDFFGDMRQLTDIYKFAFTDEGPQLAAVGAVSGRILNQYSMSEYEGYLRVATTVDERWSFDGQESPSTNHVFVLAEEGEELNVVGQIVNLAPTEEIKSARFAGPKGYLVTFEQIDPLFTLDLSDPTNPLVVGELKVPGFSTFIFEMGENHLLTIGQDASTDASFVWPQGIQLSIFDISDFANPQLAFTERIGNPDAWSEALYNPKALTYFASQDLLALPVEIYSYAYGFGFDDFETVPDEIAQASEPGDDGDREDDEEWDDGFVPPSDEFRGLYVYRVTPEGGFEFLGRMSTMPEDDNYYYNSFTRGVFMNDNVFAVTDLGVGGAPVNAVETVPWQIWFPESDLNEFSRETETDTAEAPVSDRPES